MALKASEKKNFSKKKKTEKTKEFLSERAPSVVPRALSL
jgi:hypothetical protein